MLEELNGLTCRPDAVAGRLDLYQAELCTSPSGRGVVLRPDGDRICFEFQCDHPEKLLVHEPAGGGVGSLRLLARLRLSAEMRDAVQGQLNRLPRRYDGIHVRNTDYRTDYLSFFQKLAPILPKLPILICSDDQAVVRETHRFFGAARVYTSSAIPDLGGKPLHHLSTFGDRELCREQARLALVDLMTLAHARKVYYQSCIGGGVSGYSRLPQLLACNPGVVRHLMGRRTLLPVLVPWGARQVLDACGARLRALSHSLVRALP